LPDLVSSEEEEEDSIVSEPIRSKNTWCNNSKNLIITNYQLY
jgi:hypothetical protein